MGKKTYREDEHARCPFYKKESSVEIKCEGIVGDATTITFHTIDEKNEHKYDFCNGLYQNCPIQLAIMEKE